MLHVSILYTDCHHQLEEADDDNQCIESEHVSLQFEINNICI